MGPWRTLQVVVPIAGFYSSMMYKYTSLGRYPQAIQPSYILLHHGRHHRFPRHTRHFQRGRCCSRQRT